MRQQFLTAHPEVGDALSLLGGVLDNVAMQRLNFEVDGKKKSPADVAMRFLKAKLKIGETQR